MAKNRKEKKLELKNKNFVKNTSICFGPLRRTFKLQEKPPTREFLKVLRFFIFSFLGEDLSFLITGTTLIRIRAYSLRIIV